MWANKVGQSEAGAPKLASLPPTNEAFNENVARAQTGSKQPVWKLVNMVTIYIIIRHCPGVGAFPRPFCVPNSVALASLTLQVGDWAIH